LVDRYEFNRILRKIIKFYIVVYFYEAHINVFIKIKREKSLLEIVISAIVGLGILLEDERLFVVGVRARVWELRCCIILLEVRYKGLLFHKLFLRVSPELCRPPLHNWLHILESQILLLKILEVNFALLAKHLPVYTDTEVGGVGWVGTTLKLCLIPSLLAYIFLVPLFHLVPNIKLEHSLVVTEPTVLDTRNIEAWNCKEARNDGAEADKGAEFLGFFNWIKTIMV